jgi:hypothetical protein
MLTVLSYLKDWRGMNKCKKTTHGKHLWRIFCYIHDEFICHGIMGDRCEAVEKCVACGMVKSTKLKLMVMLDMAEKKERDSDRFQKWIDEMQGRNVTDWEVFSNEKYAKYRTLKAIVENLYHERNSDKKDYYKNRPEIRRMLAEIVAMVMFIQEETKL